MSNKLNSQEVRRDRISGQLGSLGILVADMEREDGLLPEYTRMLRRGRKWNKHEEVAWPLVERNNIKGDSKESYGWMPLSATERATTPL